MTAFAFLNPLLLWAIPLAALPIIIHLLNRRRFTRVPWAAMEHLLAAMKRNRKRLRMEQWLVLLLRTLAVLFLALLVARPQLEGGGLIGVQKHHVVLLNDSASMQQRVGSVKAWSRAQDELKKLADRLADTRSGDLFSLVLATEPGQPEIWAQRVGPDLGQQVGGMVKNLSVSDRSIDLGNLLRETRERAKEVPSAGYTDYYVIGDRRSVDWVTDGDEPRPGVLSALAEMDPLEEHVSAMAVGSEESDNLAISAVRRLDRLAVAGVPVALAVDIENTGLEATQATELSVEMDGKSRVLMPVPQLAPGEKVAVSVIHTFHSAGFHRVEAALPTTDPYLVDDRRALALPVEERSKVLLVDGEPDEDLEGGETMFLQVALDPGGDQPSGVEPQVVTEGELPEVDLSPFDVVYLCNVPVPSAPTVARLEEFVAGGGGLVIFVGAQVDPERYNEQLWRGGQGLLPLPLGEIAGDPDRREHIVLTDKDHPICGKLGDVLEILCNVAVLVKRYLTVEDDPQVGAAVLARVGDSEGSPAIVSRTFGSGGGQVVLFAISADKHWSNWPDTDANLVMAHQVHRFAAKAQDLTAFNFGTEGTLLLELDPGLHKPDVSVRAVAGEGEERVFTAVLPAASSPDPENPVADSPAEEPASTQEPQLLQLQLPMTELRTLGVHEFDVELHSGLTDARAFSRNAPLDESRLVRLTQRDFARTYPPELQELVTFREDDAGFGSTSGEGELWRVLAATMLLALLLESLLAWRFGRR